MYVILKKEGKMRKISILDTTLRDGEQAPQNAMNPKQKLNLALELEALGVNHIETGFPASSKFDFEATKLISQELTLSGIATFSRTLEKDVQLAFDAAGRSKNHTIQIVATGSDIHLRNKRNITRAQSIDEMMNTVRFVYQNSDCRISVGIEDASRANYDFMKEMAHAAVDAGANQIILADTTGFSSPFEFGNLIRFIKSEVGENISVSTHCHNDLGLALANTLAGIEAGADEVQVTLGGIGERAGNASLETVASTLFFKRDIYHVYTDIILSKLYNVYQLLCSTIFMDTARNQPIFGPYVFGTAAGIHQHGILADPNTYEFVKPNIFNRQRELFVSRHSGKSIIKHLLDKKGIAAKPKLLDDLYENCINNRFENTCLTLSELEIKVESFVSQYSRD